MKRSFLLILAAIVLLATVLILLLASLSPSPVGAAVNLILNPGFEEPTADGNQPPINWEYSTTSPFRDVPPNVHADNYSAYLHGTSGNYTQTVSNITVETNYMFEAYTRANGNATERVTLTIRDSSGVVLRTHSWGNSDHGWIRRVCYISTPVNAWDAVVTLAIHGDDAGEAWFDDILLEEKMPSECLIATVAYGSYLDRHVEVLRDFRDRYLVANPVGSSLVSLYHKLSPPVAEFIEDHPALKPAVRVGLSPAIAISTVAVNTTLAEKIAIVGSFALVSIVLALWARKQRCKGLWYS